MDIQNKIFIKRVLAFLMDYLIILLPSIILIAFIITELKFSSDFGLSIFTSVFMLLMPLNILTNIPFESALTLCCITFVSVMVVYVIYCTLFEVAFGTTLGGRCTKIRCVNKKGIVLGKKEILVRNILKLLSLSCFLLGLITVSFKHRKPVYDIICKIEVVIVE